MNKFFQVSFMAVALCSMALLTSCNEDPQLPDNIVDFQAEEQGMGAADTEITVNLTLVREVESDGNIVVSYVATGLDYGADFATDPAASGTTITIPVAAGATTASFKVTKTNTRGLIGNEEVVFSLQSVADGLVLGTKKDFTLSFSEIIATSATMEVNGGGPNYPNRVFIDLSANRQTAVARTTWDLAFSSKADEFRVLLNSANGMLVRALAKTDIATVTAADTVGFGAQLGISSIFGAATSVENPANAPAWIYQSTSWMDDPKGDISKTAIAAISATASENKVYIVNRGTGPANAALGWKKIQITRDGNNYRLLYGDIGSANLTTVQITKNTDTRFQYVSLTNNNVQVEPAVGNWDIAWTALTNTTSFGGAPFAYYFQDMIIQNPVGASTAQVMITSTVTYEGFNEASLANVTLVDNNQINIGPNWRSLGQTSSALRADRFYVIKDAAGNIYKLLFTSLTSTAGERGKPSFKFDLVKKGS